MPIDQAGIDLIKHFEGFAPKASWDYSQNSVGYGSKALFPGETITPQAAEARLRQELVPIDAAIDRLPHSANLTQTQRDVLASFAYNTGPGTLTRGSLGRDLASGNYAAVGNDMQAYNRAGGQVLQGLVTRRGAEAGLWNAGGLFSPPTSGPNAQPDPITAYLNGHGGVATETGGGSPGAGLDSPGTGQGGTLGALISGLMGGSNQLQGALGGGSPTSAILADMLSKGGGVMKPTPTTSGNVDNGGGQGQFGGL
jgi:GH24 family phage-related lysozyme (muramidase)